MKVRRGIVRHAPTWVLSSTAAPENRAPAFMLLCPQGRLGGQKPHVCLLYPSPKMGI